MSIICFIILLLLFLLYTIKKHKRNWLIISLVGLYCISSIASYFCYLGDMSYYRNVNLISYLYLFTALIIAFYPIAKYRPDNYVTIEKMNITLVNLFAVFLIILFSTSIVQSIFTIRTDFSRLLYDFSYANELYADNRDVTAEQTGSSFENISAVLSGLFSELLVIFTFYYLSLKRKNKFIAVLLCISLLSPFLGSFTRGSRTVMAWWFLELFISFILLKNFYDEKLKRRIIIIGSILSAVVILIFSLLTIGRFEMNRFSSFSSAENSFVSYMGQGTLNFSNMILQNDVHQYGDNSFPLFRDLMGLESSSNLYERQQKWEGKMKIDQGVFYTFVGDICNDFGPYIGLLIILLFSLIFDRMINTNKRKVLTLTQMFSLFFFCCICFNGMFYFSYKTIGGNLKIILYILVFIAMFFSKSLVKKEKNGTYNSILSSSISPDKGE